MLGFSKGSVFFCSLFLILFGFGQYLQFVVGNDLGRMVARASIVPGFIGFLWEVVVLVRRTWPVWLVRRRCGPAALD